MTFETHRLENYDASDSSDEQYGENILPKGAVLQNRYEVVKVLGVGGMGAVYLTRDLRFSGVTRLCALKEMISTTPDPQVRRLAVQSFMREANLLVQLNHTGIPQIYDFFTEGVRSYLAMEYVQGSDLEDVLENTEGMLKEEVVLDWAVQVCDVLIYLHSRTPAIVFRDLKPSNIMLRGGNKIALIDFGIAKAFEAGQKGTMIGTEGYSPPEQYKGVADPRGDIYALGATLHHLLTKRDPRLEPPFTFHEEPPHLLNPALSASTGAVIMKALEYDPNKRFQSAQEMKNALVKALKHQDDVPTLDPGIGTQALPSSPSTTTVLPEQPGHGAVPPPGYQPSYPPPAQVYPPQYGVPYPQQPYPAPYPPAPYAYPGMPPGTHPVGEEEADDSILPIWKFKVEDEIRGSAQVQGPKLYVGAYDNNVYMLDAKTGQFQWKYAAEGGVATKPCVYRSTIIFGSEDRIVYAISEAGRLQWTCPTEGRVRSSAIVAYDHAFFGSDDNRLYAVNAQTGRVIWRFESIAPIRSTPAMGDELVYVGSEDGHLYALELSSGTAKWKFRSNRAVTSSPVVYGEMVIVGSSDWHIYSIDAKSGYVIWRYRTNQQVISSPTVVDDTVFIGSVDKNLYAIDAKSGRVQWKYNAEAPVVSTPAVTDEAIYFGTVSKDKPEVISVDRKSRKVRWRFKTEGPVPASPIVVDGIVYIGSTDHYMYALPA